MKSPGKPGLHSWLATRAIFVVKSRPREIEARASSLQIKILCELLIFISRVCACEGKTAKVRSRKFWISFFFFYRTARIGRGQAFSSFYLGLFEIFFSSFYSTVKLPRLHEKKERFYYALVNWVVWLMRNFWNSTRGFITEVFRKFRKPTSRETSRTLKFIFWKLLSMFPIVELTTEK